MQGTDEQARSGRPGLKSPAPPCAPAPLDTVLFDSLQGTLNGTTLAQIYREFLQHTRSRIEEHAVRLEPERLRALGHTVKGTAGMLGAAAVAQLALRLEERAADPAAAEEKLSAMLAACAALEAALRERQIAL